MNKPPTGSRANPVRIIHGGAGLIVAEIGAICVAIWRGAVTKADFDLQRSGLSAVVARHAEGAGFLCVIEPTAKPPDDQLRKASAEMIRSHGDRLKCVASVIEGTGFMAAVTRGVLSGMVLLVPNRKTPAQFFADIPSAADWMSEHLSVGSTVALAQSVEQARTFFPRAAQM